MFGGYMGLVFGSWWGGAVSVVPDTSGRIRGLGFARGAFSEWDAHTRLKWRANGRS